MENLRIFEVINLPTIMLEHMSKILTIKDGKLDLGYGYFLLKVFQNVGIPLEAGVKGTVKQTFSLSTLVESECVEGKFVHLRRMPELLDKQEKLNQEVENMTTHLSSKEAKIALPKAKLF